MSWRERSRLARLFLAELYHPHADLNVASEAWSSELARCVSIIEVPGDDATFLLYESASAEHVRLTGARAGLEFTRIVDARTRS